MEIALDIAKNLGLNISKLEEDLQPLDTYNVRVINESEDDFRLVVQNDEKVFVGYFNATRVKNHDNSPEDLKTIIQNSPYKVFLCSLGTDENFRKRGIGKALWEFGLLKLLARNGEFLDEVQDASRTQIDETPWTSRKLPQLHDSLEQLGVKSDVLWTGMIGNKKSYLVRHKKGA